MLFIFIAFQNNIKKKNLKFQLKSLVHRFGDGPGMRTLNMTLKSVAANVEWVSRSQNSIFNWVESNDNIGRRR